MVQPAEPLRRSSTVSYFVYLVHVAALFGLHHLLLQRDLPVDDAEEFIVALLASVVAYALTVISWRFSPFLFGRWCISKEEREIDFPRPIFPGIPTHYHLLHCC